MISNRNKWYVHALHLPPSARLSWYLQLIPEVTLQSLLLKGYYARAMALFLKSRSQINASRKDLQERAGGRRLLSLQDVASFIRESVKDRKKKFFRA